MLPPDRLFITQLYGDKRRRKYTRVPATLQHDFNAFSVQNKFCRISIFNNEFDCYVFFALLELRSTDNSDNIYFKIVLKLSYPMPLQLNASGSAQPEVFQDTDLG